MLLNSISFGNKVLNIQPKKNSQAFQGTKPHLNQDTVEFTSKKETTAENTKADIVKYAKAVEDYFYKTDKLGGPKAEEIISANLSPDDKKYAEALKVHQALSD